jgi:hypothetical protein
MGEVQDNLPLWNRMSHGEQRRVEPMLFCGSWDIN